MLFEGRLGTKVGARRMHDIVAKWSAILGSLLR